MKGNWQGTPVQASFTNRYDQHAQRYSYFTCLQADLDPPLAKTLYRYVSIGDSSVYADHADTPRIQSATVKRSTSSRGREECTLSLTHQKNGFWARLFRAQDIIVGDREFDDAFVIKGEPKEFVLATPTPSARKEILDLTHAGASFTLEHGKLAAWTNQLLTNREQLDALMKTSSLAAADKRGALTE